MEYSVASAVRPLPLIFHSIIKTTHTNTSSCTLFRPPWTMSSQFSLSSYQCEWLRSCEGGHGDASFSLNGTWEVNSAINSTSESEKPSQCPSQRSNKSVCCRLSFFFFFFNLISKSRQVVLTIFTFFCVILSRCWGSRPTIWGRLRPLKCYDGKMEGLSHDEQQRG